jgi:hypothetical protein
MGVELYGASQLKGFICDGRAMIYKQELGLELIGDVLWCNVM